MRLFSTHPATADRVRALLVRTPATDAVIGAHQPEVWIGFTAVIVFLLVLDLGILNRRPRAPDARGCVVERHKALASAFRIPLAALRHRLLPSSRRAAITVCCRRRSTQPVRLPGVAHYFAVPTALRPRVLKWGIFGAIVMRGAMIALGAFLLQRFAFIVLVFGGLLVVTGLRMFFVSQDAPIDPETNPRAEAGAPPLARKRRVRGFDGSLVRRATVIATPLRWCLAVEWTDLRFAIDSVPAIFAITRICSIVYSSNIFVIFGLRAVFFLLAGMMYTLCTKQGVAFIRIRRCQDGRLPAVPHSAAALLA